MGRKRKAKRFERKWHKTALMRNGLILLSVVAIFILVRGPGRPTPPKAYALPTVSRGLLSVPPVPAYLFHNDKIEAPRRAVIDGQELFFRVETVEGTPRDVIRFYRTKYEHSTTDFFRAVLALGGKDNDQIRQAIRGLDRFYHAATDNSGMLVALEMLDPDATPEDLRAQLEAFVKTGKLGELWVARVINVYAQGDSGKSSVVSFWTGPNFNIWSAMKPYVEPPPAAEADEPDENAFAPLLTVAFPDEPRPLRFELSWLRQDAPAAIKQTKKRLLADGWQEDTVPPEGSGNVPDSIRMLKRGGEEVNIIVANDPEDQRATFVGMMHWQSSET